ncbi:NAD-dependent epimerase/dehydratase family protein [Curvivirga sp.]|uniref:NAD-dependent epimerase/dehydratase family protein n=1 Tax=Curvivirga sp. TaxID=2856848 RepID=UPI003B5C13BA
MSKYLVTGGCGFIGSHLCEALSAEGHEVVVLDNLSTGKKSNLTIDVDLHIGDVANHDDVKKAMKDVDGCFHLAAIASVEQSLNDWPGSHRINVGGTVNVFDCARENKTPVVYASSAAIYGDNANIPLSETDRPRPLSAYGADKLGCEYHAKVAGLSHNIPSAGMRFFNVFGPRQDPSSPYSGVISIFIDRLISGQELKIFGTGQQVRDFIYVKDVVRFLLAAMAKTSSDAEVYNVCTGQTTSINQLAIVLSMIAKKPLSIERLPQRNGDIQVSLGNAEKAYKLLGIKAETRLSDAFQKTYASHTQEKLLAAE